MPCQGCNQRSRQNIGAGMGEVEGYCTVQRAWRLRVEGVPMLLGFWWMLVSVMYDHLVLTMTDTQDGVRGGPDTVPVVNIVTSAQESPDKEQNWRLRCKCQLM